MKTSQRKKGKKKCKKTMKTSQMKTTRKTLLAFENCNCTEKKKHSTLMYLYKIKHLYKIFVQV